MAKNSFVLDPKLMQSDSLSGEALLGGQGGAIAPPILIVGGHCPPSPIQKLVTLYHYMKKRKDTLEHFNQSFCMMYYSLKN